MNFADRTAGAVQGAADAAKGHEHSSRAWVSDPGTDAREASARERWHSGESARNQFERDVFHALEIGISGHDRPREAAAARRHPPYLEANREAGQ
jgi:hypothetical protein